MKAEDFTEYMALRTGQAVADLREGFHWPPAHGALDAPEFIMAGSMQASSLSWEHPFFYASSFPRGLI